MQSLIAFDQLVNTLVWLKSEGFGKCKETQDKLNASNGGQSQGAVASIMGKLLGKK